MPAPDKKPKTLYDKIFQDHIVKEQEDGTILLYIGLFPLDCCMVDSYMLTSSIDRHLVHEVTSPVSSSLDITTPNRVRISNYIVE